MNIPDVEILAWLLSGDLIVDLDNPTTIEIFGRTVKGYEIGGGRGRPEGSHTRFAFGLRHKGRRRTIVRGKLVYMAGARRVVPAGFEVAHRDDDRYNDAFENLIMLTEEDHKKFDGKFSKDEVPF